MRALVISGGGSKGAWAGGFAEYLIKDLARRYDIFVACSTGSLLIPFLASNRIDEIKEVYTNVTQSDIFDIDPFKIKYKEDGSFSTSINHLNSVRRFMTRKKTFGEHRNLRETICKTMTEDIFTEIKQSGKRIVVTVSNMTTGKISYKHIQDWGYEDFVDWMWASTSFVPFMSLVEKNGHEYADGGFGNYLPIEEAVNLGANEIDVIVLNPRHMPAKQHFTSNIFSLLLRTMSFMHNQLAYHDLLIGHLESIYNDQVKVHFHFTPTQLTEYSFVFNPSKMKQWWKDGYESAKQKYPHIR